MVRLSLVALCALVVMCAAQDTQVIRTDSLPFDDPRCKSNAWTKVDKTGSYVAGFNGTAKICIRSYVDVCVGPQGIQVCNPQYGSCRDVKYDWKNKVAYPEVLTTVTPNVCVSEGDYIVSDARVLIIVQVIFGLFTLVPAFIVALPAINSVRGVSKFVVIFQLLSSLLLMFSYYYLNGIVQLAATLIAVTLYRTRKPVFVAIGILFCLAAFFWVTYRFGLGNMQHQARFNAGLETTDFFQKQCVNFYRGYFQFAPAIADIDANVEDFGWGFCMSRWLAAELFFQIFAEALLVLLAATGVQSLLMEEEKPTMSETEPAAN